MTKAEAIKFLQASESDIVLVATNNLQEQQMNTFKKVTKNDCYVILENSKKRIAIHDEFVKQLNCFTEQQNQYPVITPKGVQHIILIK